MNEHEHKHEHDDAAGGDDDTFSPFVSFIFF